MIRIAASCGPGEIRIAVLAADRLIRYALWRPGRPDGLGDLYNGRVTARCAALAGAFVDLGTESGFLPDTAGGRRACEGDRITVRVIRAAQGGKGVRLALAEDVASAPPGLLARGPGPLERLATRYPDAPIMMDGPAVRLALPAGLRERCHLVPAAFDPEIETAIAALADTVVALPGGAHFSIHPTPALIAIDCDLGPAAAGGQDKERAAFAANRRMIPEIARHIVLRELSGVILIDFAGLAPKRRALLRPDLLAALAADDSRPRLLGFTATGMAELLRPRATAPLHEASAGPHAAGLRALHAAGLQGCSTLAATPDIVAALEADSCAVAWMTENGLALRSDPSLPPPGWRIA